MHDIVVIGGGPAGVVAALRCRELGAQVALVERDQLGGTCTNDGCVPTRVLAKAARLIRDAEQYPDYGMTGDKPDIDLGKLISLAQDTVYRVHEKKQLLDHLHHFGVTVHNLAGEARFKNSHELTLGHNHLLESEKFILCAGGHARRLSFPGSEHALTHNDVWKLKKLPDSVIIVGGAATGCQLASIFAAFGCQVTILDVAPTILSVEDEEVSSTMTECFKTKGIQIITEISGVEKIEPSRQGFNLNYGLKGEVHSIEAETVIMAVGWVGNIENLNLDAAGVKTNHGYVEVSDSLQTTAPHIFAAGDITGRMMLVQSATYEGRIAAENAILGSDRSFRHEVVPHGGFTDPEYGSVGLTEREAIARGDCATAIVPYASLDRAVIDGRTEGFCKLVVSPESGLLLGAHVVGEQAVEVVQLASAGMAANIHLRQMAELELAYPTFTAIIGLAARRLVNQLGLTPLAPVWRELSELKKRPAEWEIRSS
jgi:dihydrolipoamide dehydrogenase